MDSYVIEGGKKLYGEVRVQRSKNAVLPMLAGALLTEEKIVLRECPAITDVKIMKSLLSVFSKTASGEETVTIEGESLRASLPSYLCAKLRASSLFLGACLAVFGEVELPLPGGCAIGKRPIDLHLSALRSLGVSVVEGEGFVRCRVMRRRGGRVVLPYPSVGATENLLLYSVLSEGETILSGVAREPEIVDFVSFLKSMGAKIRGAGESEMVVEGVSRLRGTEYTPMFDRIECGSYLIACACTGGEIEILGNGLQKKDLLLAKLRQNGCKIALGNDKIQIKASRDKMPFSLRTGPYPAFATDLHPMMGTLAALSGGESLLVETVFENRFSYLTELERMGAIVHRNGNFAFVGGGRLHGATVLAHDLRGGAALLLAGLSAEGKTIVLHPEYIDRGYTQPEIKFASLGARIERKPYE